jgi:NarL family two-component system response regulator LiaR
MKNIRILLADDHPLVSEGTSRILQHHAGMEVVGQADNGEKALTLAKQLQPDVAILDIRMPQVNGVDVIRRIKDYSPNTKTLILTAYDNDEYVLAVMEAGATGYLLKTCKPDDLIKAVANVAQGVVQLDPCVMNKVANLWRGSRDKTVNALTSRELEVLKLAADGLRNRGIAEKLSISIRTVEGHFASIFSKLGVESRVEAIIFAVSKNLFTLPGENVNSDERA